MCKLQTYQGKTTTFWGEKFHLRLTYIISKLSTLPTQTPTSGAMWVSGTIVAHQCKACTRCNMKIHTFDSILPSRLEDHPRTEVVRITLIYKPFIQAIWKGNNP